MADNVVYLHGKPREVAQVTRVGFSEHRLCEQLLSANKLASRRYVVEAAFLQRQRSLLRTLKDSKVEVVLDTNCAELSVPGRCSGAVRTAPWAHDDQPLEPGDFVAGTNRSVIEPIARLAVKQEVAALLSPSHFLGDKNADWLRTDLESCAELRLALDREGGKHIPIDYQVIATYAQLRDPEFRRTIINGIHGLPIARVWLRISGFGADATGVGISRYIESVRAFHELNMPIIADHVGGLASLALAAFGAVSGFASGIGGKQRFDASGWLKPDGGGGGNGSKRIYVPGLDRTLAITELRQLFDETRTARHIFGCSDPSCCGDVEKMLGNPVAHQTVQLSRAAAGMSNTPESLRTSEYLDGYLSDCLKDAKRATRIKNMGPELRGKVNASAKKLDLTKEALWGLYERHGDCEFALEAKLRLGSRQLELDMEKKSS